MFLLLQKVEISTAKTDMTSRRKIKNLNPKIHRKSEKKSKKHSPHTHTSTLTERTRRVLLPKFSRKKRNTGKKNCTKLCIFKFSTKSHYSHPSDIHHHQHTNKKQKVRCKTSVSEVEKFLRINNKVTNWF